MESLEEDGELVAEPRRWYVRLGSTTEFHAPQKSKFCFSSPAFYTPPNAIFLYIARIPEKRRMRSCCIKGALDCVHGQKWTSVVLRVT